jgi:tetratricopeptide (TPR) repeat protein
MSTYAHKSTNVTAEKFYLGFVKEILFDWAGNECAMNHWTEGLDKYRRAIIIDGKDASLYNNMAFVYLHLGDKKDAYLSLQQALRVDPSFTQARRNFEHLSTP